MNAFVKFFGQATSRSPRAPAPSSTPSAPPAAIASAPTPRAADRGRCRDGDLMFMGHLVSGPSDIVVGPYAFGPTAESADRGTGNVDPRKSIRQAAAVRLSEAGASWLNEEFEARFREFGKLPGNKLDFD